MRRASAIVGGLLCLSCAAQSPPSGRAPDASRPPLDASSPGAQDAGSPVPAIDYASVSGVVWAPGNAPGMVPDRHEIGVFDALVRVTPERLAPIPDQVYCEACRVVSGPHARSGHDGAFTLSNVVPGTYWLTIEKGQFRLEQEITLGPGETLDLETAATTLPSVHEPNRGRYVPSIAVATGNADALEDVLGKMGIGRVSAIGDYTLGPGSERIHWYGNGGDTYPGQMGSIAELTRDLDRMLSYHIIFIPCTESESEALLRGDEAIRRNVRDYVAAGGRLYVTDWSGEWMDNIFPAFVQLESSEVDTPPAAYDREADTWNPSLFGSANGEPYDSHNAEVVDDDLFAWLDPQWAPRPFGGEGDVDASLLSIVGNWNTILGVERVEVGVDAEGLPVTNMPTTFVIGGHESSTPKRPLTLAFEPTAVGACSSAPITRLKNLTPD